MSICKDLLTVICPTYKNLDYLKLFVKGITKCRDCGALFQAGLPIGWKRLEKKSTA